jgi:hypothetical protein
VGSVTLPCEDDDELQPEHMSTEKSSSMCWKFEDLYWKKENILENNFKITDDLQHFVQKGMLPKFMQRKL